jgi:RND family efflux transporter MFP subunit
MRVREWKKSFWPVAAALLALSPCMTGCNAHRAAGADAVPPPVEAASVPAAVSGTAAVTDRKQKAAERFATTGPLMAEQQADIAAERDGRVVRIAVEIGDRVRQGQLLASLDDRALIAAVDARSARVASLQAQMAEWEAEQKMDEADLRRADAMREQKIVSQENWEHTKYKLDEVFANIARSRADEASAEAELRAARLQLEKSRVLAPFSGVVGRRSLRLNQEVKTGDVLFWITAEAPLRIPFTVPESAMAAFSVGAPLELTTPAYPDLHQRARVYRVSPVVDPASDSVQVVGAVDHPSPRLKPGMSMQVALAGRTPAAP